MTAARRLCIVVASPPERGDLAPALALARAALAAEVDVALFFMADAVAALPAVRAPLVDLVDRGAEAVACGNSAARYGLGEAELGIAIGSQDDHARMVTRADRLVGFT